jgi:hypothetical protein
MRHFLVELHCINDVTDVTVLNYKVRNGMEYILLTTFNIEH